MAEAHTKEASETQRSLMIKLTISECVLLTMTAFKKISKHIYVVPA